MGNTFYFSFEPKLMIWLQSVLGENGSKAVGFFSEFGEATFIIFILLILYWCVDKEFGIYVGTNVLMGLVYGPLIKNIVLRRRPYFDNEMIKCFRPVEADADIYSIAAQGFSFPSMHSTVAVTFFGSLARYAGKRILTVIAFVIPFLVGLSRVVVGVHYPTDVFVGWGMGIVIVFLMPYIYEKAGKDRRWVVNLVVFLIACVGIFYCRTEDYFTTLGLMAGFFIAEEFEKRYVNFKITRNPIRAALRLIGGLIIFFSLNTILKMPFSKEFLEAAQIAAFLLRALRYAVVIFVVTGIYPMIFGRLFKPQK